MAKNYTLPTDQRPTFWNIDTAVGLTIGSLLGGIGAPIGAVIGGFMGKSRMENERENGIQTSEPSFWNKGFVAGWSLGQLAVTPILLAGALMGLPLEPLLGVGLLGAAGGAIYGGSARKDVLAERHQTAKAIEEGQAIGVPQGRSHERSHEPEKAKEAAYDTPQRSDGKAWTAFIDEQSAAQGLASNR